ncbi:MAG: rhodanese-like domain-containing protein [Cocleimonas sp.]|nr:rhodanese-like domain-containing protein [Cocleimonas sp.]
MFGVRETDAASLKEMLDNKAEKKVRLIDVRSQAEFAQGIIEGAEFMPLHTLPARLNEFSEDDQIVIYCRSGARSAQACRYLSENTNIEALNLRSGIIAWYQAGFEIVRPTAEA